MRTKFSSSNSQYASIFSYLWPDLFYNTFFFTAITLSNLPATNSKLMCKNSDIKYNSTLKGGIKAGNFTDLGKISEISTCIRMCCGRKDCDVALMLEANCYAVNCYNEDLCQPVLARKSGLLTNLSPRLSYITSRDEEGMSYIVKISI